MDPLTQKCTKCKKHLPLTQFVPERGTKTLSQCASCRASKKAAVAKKKSNAANTVTDGFQVCNSCHSLKPLDQYIPESGRRRLKITTCLTCRQYLKASDVRRATALHEPPQVEHPPVEAHPVEAPQVEHSLVELAEDPLAILPEWAMILAFREGLSAEKMDTYLHYDETWFSMNVKDNICARCRKVDLDATQCHLFSKENNMHPGQLPTLPELTQVEEMLIARVHVFMEVRLVRGQQFKYRGHIVNFLRDIGKVFT
ncbi:hypothetical protein N7495_006661 [Penicillium taxi]|uniref:uncharacterized protein n=1 Tax=Penicillium taxi TaxID=168475 RepID=UPI002544FEF7|nr:uncharacterized protein N7495_006661 [Penicillium taxi]KAJ5894970.1 hypothetical protein N7495_006661 [Penicillium taxi]